MRYLTGLFDIRLRGKWLLLCLGLFVHALWVTGQSDVNIVEHMARGDVLQTFAADDHEHHHGPHGEAEGVEIASDSDNPLDVHHHHHFSETAGSLLPSLAVVHEPLGIAVARLPTGNMPAPDGVRPAGPFQPPRA
ncbi:MAG: hypothetical protein QM667_06690 [Asticcacaulis sp.]